jgi:hypothetical protein
MSQADPNTISFQVVCGGDSEILRALGIPLCEALEADVDGIEMRRDDVPAILNVSQRPTASVSGVAAILGVLAFLGSWAAKKTLDEIYTSRIRPKIDEVLRSAAAQALSRKRGKWLFQLGVWYEEERVFILLTLAGDNVNEVITQEVLLPHIHSHAVNWVRENGGDPPVHLYIVENGRANLAPITFNDAADAQRYLERLWPVIIPTDGSSQ